MVAHNRNGFVRTEHNDFAIWSPGMHPYRLDVNVSCLHSRPPWLGSWNKTITRLGLFIFSFVCSFLLWFVSVSVCVCLFGCFKAIIRMVLCTKKVPCPKKNEEDGLKLQKGRETSAHTRTQAPNQTAQRHSISFIIKKRLFCLLWFVHSVMQDWNAKMEGPFCSILNVHFLLSFNFLLLICLQTFQVWIFYLESTLPSSSSCLFPVESILIVVHPFDRHRLFALMLTKGRITAAATAWYSLCIVHNHRNGQVPHCLSIHNAGNQHNHSSTTIIIIKSGILHSLWSGISSTQQNASLFTITKGQSHKPTDQLTDWTNHSLTTFSGLRSMISLCELDWRAFIRASMRPQCSPFIYRATLCRMVNGEWWSTQDCFVLFVQFTGTTIELLDRVFYQTKQKIIINCWVCSREFSFLLVCFDQKWSNKSRSPRDCGRFCFLFVAVKCALEQ